jgi:exonuclease V gamma subunit
MLQIAVEKVADVIINSLALNAAVEEGGDDFTEIPDIDDELEFAPPKEDAHQELKRVIDKFNEEERQNLVALAWVGRGSYSVDEWEDAVKEAEDLNPERISEYLLNMERLGDYLEIGLSELGYSSEQFETGYR